jgi:hypothetical protein
MTIDNAYQELERMRANTLRPLARASELEQRSEEEAQELLELPCYFCVAPEHRMEEQPAHRWPVRKIVRRQTAGSADPTESYTLECGHTII